MIRLFIITFAFQVGLIAQPITGQHWSMTQQALDWQNTTNLQRVIGLVTNSWTHATAVGSGAGGRTFLNGATQTAITNNCIQDGYIEKVFAYVSQVGTSQQLKFKVFRYDGTNFNMISESETIDVSGSAGFREFSLSSPMIARPGDQLGFWVNGDSTEGNQCQIGSNSGSANDTIYTTGDVTTSNAFTNSASSILNISGHGKRPWICITGDSIAKGSGYDSFLADSPISGPAWSTTYWDRQPLYDLQLIQPSVKYQNHGKGSMTFAWVLSTGTPSALLHDSEILQIHCGVNDISASRTWASVESDLDGIKALVANKGSNTCLVVNEILPWTNGTDEQAATIRTWNTNLATWCSANGAVLFPIHDDFGKLRVSTGFLDDLKSEYNLDGIHPNSTGSKFWAQKFYSYAEGGKFKFKIPQFIPSSISDMVFGFEPRYGAYYSTSPNLQATNGQYVATLPDYWSGNGNDVSQSTESKRPTYSANAYSTIDGVLFNQTNSSALTFASDLIGTNAFTIAYRLKLSGSAPNPNRIIDNGKVVIYGNAGGPWYCSRNGSTTFGTFGGLSAGTWYNVVVTSTGASPSIVNCYVNGAQSGTANQSAGNPANGTTTLTLGNRAALDRGLNGTLLYCFMWNRILTAGEIALLNRYMQ